MIATKTHHLINIRLLKKFALYLQPTSTLRKVLLSEKDTITAEEFIVKTGTWLKLMKLDSEGTR